MKFFSYIFSGSIHVGSKRKVIPSREFSDLWDTKQILEKALEEKKELYENTKNECELLRQKAYEEGFQKGLEEFNSHILSLNDEAKKIYHEVQKMILPLALKAAQKIVKKEIETYPNTIVDIVSEVIAPAKDNKKITIFVNKKDLEALEDNKSRIKQLLEQIQVLSIQAKEDVSPGGCIIETESGIINASIENQWLALEMAFDRYKQP